MASGEDVVYGRTEEGQFFYDVCMSNKKISYLERKWKRKGLRELRYLGRAILRGDKKAAKFWRKRRHEHAGER